MRKKVAHAIRAADPPITMPGVQDGLRTKKKEGPKTRNARFHCPKDLGDPFHLEAGVKKGGL